MPVIVVDSIGTGARLAPLAGTTTIIAGNARIQSTNVNTIDSAAADVKVHVTAGAEVVGAHGGVYLSNVTLSGRSLTVDMGGAVLGAVYGAAVTGDHMRIDNAGQIAGSLHGIIYQMNDASDVGVIANSGLIVGNQAIFNNTNADAGKLWVTNSGQILGSLDAFVGAQAITSFFTNTGKIVGSMRFGSMNDTLDNGTGRVDGAIDMGGGDDYFAPGFGAENANGGTGSDTLDFTLGGAVKVHLDGAGFNSGNATDDVYGAFENIHGSDTGSDLLRGNFDKNRLEGRGGNDTLLGMADADTLLGGGGNDWIDGGTAIDQMEGGAGNDIFIADSASDVIIEAAGGGIDTVYAMIAATLAAQVENGIVGLTSGGSLTGNILSNQLSGGMGADRLTGADGHDTLLGSSGNDSLDGGTGNDSLNGGTGADTLRGGQGNDVFVIDHVGDSVIELAGGGSDLVQSALNLTLAAEVERGQILGTLGRSLIGNSLSNTLTGGAGHDNIKAMAGSDVLNGGAGKDTLAGGLGTDTLTGGFGADRFHFAAPSEGIDRITDFAAGDKISIAVAGFGGGLAKGALAAQAFVVRADNVVQDANDRFIFRTSDHSLWYDKNGNAAGGLTAVAVLSGSHILGAGDFLLV